MSEVSAAAVDAPPATTSLPWTQKLICAVPLEPFWTAVGIWTAIVCLFVGYFAVLGGPGEQGIRNVAFWHQALPPTLIMALVIAYAPAATAYSQRAALRILTDLRPVLHCSDAEFEQLARRTTAFDMRRLRAAGFVFALLVVPFVAFDPSMEFLRSRESVGGAFFAWVFSINVVLNWMLARLIFHELQVSREFSRIGERYAKVDLLNVRPLVPFARRGLQGALVWILFVSLMSLHYAVGSAADIVAPVLFALLGVAVIALLLPVWGVHRRLAEQKRRELERLCAQIGPARERLLEARADAPLDVATRLSVLLTLKQQVEAAREWPFDVPTLARFALYVAIGLGSWLGGAVVERILDAAVSGP
jgi:hypothetical protein